MARKASATWNGTLKEGDGTMALGSGAWEGPYSFRSRFEEGDGTNPEELIGAAIAGCFSMQLAAQLESDGHRPFVVASDAKVHMRQKDGANTITRIDLETVARVEGVDQDAFDKAVEQAKNDCLVARALAGVEEIEVEARLEE